MTVINHKSISGITSITAPAGSDDLLTVHTNDTTERFRIVDSGAIVTGVTTASNFKTGTTNVHNVGVELAGINVLGADTPIGTGATIYDAGGAVFTGVVTATSFSGAVTGTASGNPTLTNGANNRVITATGTNAIQGESTLTYNGSQLSITGSQNSYLNNNILSFDRAGYSYIDQLNDNGSLVFRVTSSYTNALRLDNNAQAIFGGSLVIPDAIQHEGDLDCKIRFPGTDTITFETASNERLRITSGGKVLIGDGTTYSPNGLLHIVGDDNSNGPELYLQVNNNNTTDNIGALWFGNNVDKSLVKLAGHTHTANNTADFTVSTSSGGTLGERLRIDSSGNVNFGANKTVALPSGTGIQVYNSSAPRIKLVNDTTGNAAGDGLQIYVTGSSAIFDQKEDADMRFYTDATEKFRITSGFVASFGNSSPPAWADDSGYYNIQLGKTGFLRSDTDTTNTFMTLGQNAYKDSGGWKYAQNGGASSIFQQGGDIIFESAASGTAGNAVSLTPKVRIKSGGEVRIGANSTTASTAGDDLVIEGSSDRGLSIITGTSSSANIYFGDTDDANIGRIAYQHNDNALDFSVNAGSTALRIDSQGKLGIKQTNPSAYLDISQGGIDSNVPGINIGMTGVGGGTAGEQYGIKITGGGYNNATHIYGLYINKSAQLTQNNTAAYCRMQGVYSTLTGVRGIAKCQDTAASGTIYAGHFTAQGDIGSAKTKVGYGIWAESTGTKFQLSCAGYFKTFAGATLIYGIIYNHAGSEKFRVDSAGGVWSANNSYSSDRDIKDNIVDLSGTSLDKIKQLTPRRFTWKLDDKVTQSDTLTGLIAQEVQPILPDIVTGTDGEKDMGINYNGLVAHLVNAVKELSAENEAMRARLDALESS